MLLEDILDPDQKPKYDNSDAYDAFILKMLRQDERSKKIVSEQVTLILGEHYVLTIQERRGDVFTPVRERIKQKKGRVRLNDNDYLAYALMDTIVDNYTILVEEIGSKVEELEDIIFLKRDSHIIEEIYKYKVELNYLRKTIRPVKDIMTQLIKTESSYFQDKNKIFLNDLNDLVIQSTDAIELYNNLISDQLNIYNSTISNRMNEVMKVLTIFASIFIPLTFLAGIYGMNFEYLPELKFKYSYPIFWFIALMVGGVMLYFYRKNKWL
jgi:magnesium transporter